MDIDMVVTQMIVIFVILGIGYFVGLMGKVNKLTISGLSYIVANITNPALMITGALNKTGNIPIKKMILMAVISVVIDIFLIFLGIFVRRIICAPNKQGLNYELMTLFGNTGMIGLPVIAAVLGTDSLAYLGIFNIFYMFLMYTYGIYLLEKTVGKRSAIHWKTCYLNPGCISSIIAIVLFTLNFKPPFFLKETINVIGNSTCFLSIIIIGVFLSEISLSELFKDTKLYIFILTRFFILPAIIAILMRRFSFDTVIVNVCVLILCMPVANMPAILAEERGLEKILLLKGIVLSTICSLLFIPIIVIII